MDAATSGEVEIKPTRYIKGYLDWLSEKRDWPIGRQLWWGHQIPIWYCPDVDESVLKTAFAGREDVLWRRNEADDGWLLCSLSENLKEDAVAGCTIERDEDVLDTWFSSALWPHSTLGWPDKTPELEYYYPTSFDYKSRYCKPWVARMVLLITIIPAKTFRSGVYPSKILISMARNVKIRATARSCCRYGKIWR